MKESHILLKEIKTNGKIPHAHVLEDLLLRWQLTSNWCTDSEQFLWESQLTSL